MKIKFLLMSLFCSSMAMAQDIIVKKDGSTILAKVIKVGDKEIEYKKYQSTSDRLYSISTSEIMAINYEDGEKDVFKGSASTVQETEQENNDPKFVQVPVSADNANIIERYNKDYTIGKKWKLSKKIISSCLGVFGISKNSIMANEDIEISIVRRDFDFRYIIMIKNKTDKFLYIDKANCFRVSPTENFCYYNSGTQVSSNHGSGMGASVNLGGIANAIGIGGTAGTIANGINVGGAKNQSTTKTYGQQRVIVLPPHQQISLAEDKWIEKQQLERDEYYAFTTMPKIHKGETLFFDNQNSIFTINYVICYSNNQNFTEYSTMNFQLYLKQVFGTPLSGFSGGLTDDGFSIISRRIEGIDTYCIIGYFGNRECLWKY